MPGARVESGARVDYCIIGENARICRGAQIGAEPDGTDGWGVATCGPDLTVGENAVVPAGAMLYENVKAGERK